MNLVNSLSNHLFWDIDKSKLEPQKHSKQIIYKVLHYGLYEDWVLIKGYYGLNNIVDTAITIRDLDRKTASFLSVIADIPKDSFLCYTSKQSIPKHWNF